ncbi:MAG: hypothetical protein JNM57_09205 [Cyclobacteriaceae bacterium]|nr:hypothetical protein [Cyclobacteriaceae bacterium]
MKLDSDLKGKAEALEVKRKAVTTMPIKYNYGPYRIISGKAGWTKSKSNTKFFSWETKVESRRKSSLVFVGHDKDTVVVNMSTNTSTRELNVNDWSMLNESTENFAAIMTTSLDTITWRLMLVSRSGAQVEGKYQADGMLTNGSAEIQIREVKQWESGKAAAFNAIIGYEFFNGSQSIAAVQASPDTFQKRFVWLRNDLDEPTKLILAATAAAIMNRVDETIGE